VAEWTLLDPIGVLRERALFRDRILWSIDINCKQLICMQVNEQFTAHKSGPILQAVTHKMTRVRTQTSNPESPYLDPQVATARAALGPRHAHIHPVLHLVLQVAASCIGDELIATSSN
jgi:hypothetical protein